MTSRYQEFNGLLDAAVQGTLVLLLLRPGCSQSISVPLPQPGVKCAAILLLTLRHALVFYTLCQELPLLTKFTYLSYFV